MTLENIQTLIKKPEDLNRETLYELRNLIARFPYFQTVRLLYLKNLYLLHDAHFGEELRKSVLYITDRSILFYLIEGEHYKLSPRQKLLAEKLEEEPENFDRTLSLINSFLSTIPEIQETPLSLSLDYTPYLIDRDQERINKSSLQEDVPVMKHQELIDDFIEKSENENSTQISIPEEEVKQETEISETFWDENEEDESYFTETLARIYVKQKRYSKALEIIKKLSLKYPKKNAYFADQIRFLEKLIINTKSQ